MVTMQMMAGTVACEVLDAEETYATCLLPPLRQQGLHAVSVEIAGQIALAHSRMAVAAAFQIADVQPDVINPTGAATHIHAYLLLTCVIDTSGSLCSPRSHSGPVRQLCRAALRLQNVSGHCGNLYAHARHAATWAQEHPHHLPCHLMSRQSCQMPEHEGRMGD